MWVFDRTLLEIAVRTTIIYVVVLVGIRLTGKREVGQLTPFDLVLLLLIANAVQNAMVGPDTSLTGGLLSAAVLIVANYVVAAGRERVPILRRAVQGSPTLLINDGKFVGLTFSIRLTCNCRRSGTFTSYVVYIYHLAILNLPRKNKSKITSQKTIVMTY